MNKQKYGTYYTIWDKLPNGRNRTKKEISQLKSFWNKKVKQNINLECNRIIIDDNDYFIDVQEMFIGRLL